MTKQGRGRIAGALLAAVVLGAGTSDAAAADPRLQGLASLYQDDALAGVAGFCSQRLPDTQVAWEDLLGHWRAANRTRLDELQRLQDRVAGRLHARPVPAAELDDWLAIASARAGRAAAQTRVFASMSDAQARQFCDDARSQDADIAIDGDQMSEAHAAAALALKLLDAPD